MAMQIVGSFTGIDTSTGLLIRVAAMERYSPQGVVTRASNGTEFHSDYLSN